MATPLLDKLRKKRKVRGPGGRLVEETTESVQRKAAKLGIAPPITAVGTGALGTTEQQRAMAGTPAQKKSALELAQQQTLQEAQRRRQFRTEQTEEEKAKQEKSQALANLGELGDRVQKLIAGELNKASTVTGPIARQVNEEAVSQAQLQNEVAPEQFQAALQTLGQAATADQQQVMEAMVTINKALGKQPSAPVTMDELKQFYGDMDEATASAIAAAVPDQILVTDELTQSLGVGSVQDLANLLQTTPEQLQSLSVSQLDELVNQVQAQEFNRVEELRSRLKDPTVSAAEKQAIADELRALGASGVRASEDEVKALVEDLGQAPIVKIGDKEMPVDQALADESISAIVIDYLNNPDSEAADALSPEFKDWIDKHKNALLDASQEMQEEVGTFSDIQAKNLALQEAGGVKLDDNLMKELFPSWGEFATAELDTSKYPVFDEIFKNPNIDEGTKASIASNLNELAKIDTGLAKGLASLSKEQLDKLGVTTNSPQWRTYIERAKKLPAVKRASNFRELFKTYVGGVYDPMKAYDLVEQQGEMEKFGFKTPSEWKKVKGVFGDPSEFSFNNINSIKDKITQEVLAGGDITRYQQYQKPQLSSSDFTALEKNPDYKLYLKTRDYLKKPGIWPRDAQQLSNSLSYDEYQKLQNLPAVRNNPKSAASMKRMLKDKVNKKYKNLYRELYKATGGAISKAVAAVQKLAALPPPAGPIDTIDPRAEERLKALQEKERAFAELQKYKGQIKNMLRTWRSGSGDSWNKPAADMLLSRLRGYRII